MRAKGSLIGMTICLALASGSAFAQCDGNSTGKIPLNDLGTGTYLGFQGGLYPNGENEPPLEHALAARRMAGRIVPRNLNGAPATEGKIVLLSIGMSNTNQEFSVFERQEDLNPSRNARLVILNGAVGGQTASAIRDPNASYWQVVQDRLAAIGASSAQVQVVWLKEANAQPPNNFPTHAEQLQEDLRAVVQVLHGKFPNLLICYMSSRTYGGYATTPLNPEPQAYESNFGVKWLIEDQIDGDPSLNFNPDRGTVAAPLLLWGPYLWADGIAPRSDGLIWCRQDFEGDGTHPAPPGEQKVANLLSEFFASEPSARIWFSVKPGAVLQTVNVQADAYVRADQPTSNFGNSPQLRSRGGSSASHIYLRFDVRGLERPIRYAKLSLRAGGGSGAPRQVSVVSNSNWNEGTINFNNAPAIDGPSLQLVPLISREGTFAADVTAAINNDPDGILTLAITTTDSQIGEYLSRESGQAPRLILTIEEPIGDVNGDGCVDDTDLAAVIFAFGSFGPTPADVNGDGIVNDRDLAIVVFQFGDGC